MLGGVVFSFFVSLFIDIDANWSGKSPNVLPNAYFVCMFVAK